MANQRELFITISADGTPAIRQFQNVKRELEGLRGVLGRRSPLGETLEFLKGAGPIAGVGIAAHEFGAMASEIAKSVNQGKSFSEILLDSVPVVGSLVHGALDLSDAMAGTTNYVTRMNEEVQAGNAAFEKRVELAKQTAEFLKSVHAEVGTSSIAANALDFPGSPTQPLNDAAARKTIDDKFDAQIKLVCDATQKAMGEEAKKIESVQEVTMGALFGRGIVGGIRDRKEGPSGTIDQLVKDMNEKDRIRANVKELQGKGEGKIAQLEAERNSALGQLAISQSQRRVAGRSGTYLGDVGGPIDNLLPNSPLLNPENNLDALNRNIENRQHRISVTEQLNQQRIRDLEDEVKAGHLSAIDALRNAKLFVDYDKREVELRGVINDALASRADRERAKQELDNLPDLKARSDLLARLSDVDLGPRRLATSGGRGGAGNYSFGDLQLSSFRNAPNDHLKEISDGIAALNKKLDNPIKLVMSSSNN